MNAASYFHLFAGLPQLVVVGLTLLLYRRFGAARVGWTLVGGFTLLAVLYLLFFSQAFEKHAQVQIRMDLAYTFTSLFLLIILVLLGNSLRVRLRIREMQQQAETELKARLAEQSGDLSRTNAELEDTVNKLQAEIEERKRMQEQMEKTHRDLLTVTRQAGMSEVATGVLHNVGNVLNSVNVSAGMLADHLRQSKIEYVCRIAQLLHQNSARLAEFITQDEKGRQLPAFLNQLADHLEAERRLLIRESDGIRSKVEHIKEIVATQQSYGRVSGVAERVRLTNVMDDVLQIHAAELTKHGVQVHREYESPLPDVIVDKHKVLQILLNLVSNANHACSDSGRENKEVRVRVANGGHTVRVAIQDNGVGIPAANLNKIFHHGFTTRKNNGHGFGLHSGALAARELGGQLTAQSDGPAKGATFTLELPLKPAGD